MTYRLMLNAKPTKSARPSVPPMGRPKLLDTM